MHKKEKREEKNDKINNSRRKERDISIILKILLYNE